MKPALAWRESAVESFSLNVQQNFVWISDVLLNFNLNKNIG